MFYYNMQHNVSTSFGNDDVTIDEFEVITQEEAVAFVEVLAALGGG